MTGRVTGHLRGAAGELAATLLVAATLAIPYVTGNLLVYSLAEQILVAATAAFSVYIMLRMDLLCFATPAFMALGGYAVAILATVHGVTDALLLSAASMAVPAAVALPLGALVLRLRGTYFVLVTFVLTEILQLLLFVTPGLTGGSNGVAGIPAVTLFGTELGDNQAVLLLTGALALLGAVVTAALTLAFRPHFAAIEENEPFAESLGLVVWRYKALGFAASAAVAGLAGFALVDMLLTAHPSSFTSATAVNTIAYAIIGGRGSMLGPLVGSALLVFASNMFGSQGEYSAGLYGLLIIVFTLLGKGGLVGTAGLLLRRIGRRNRGHRARAAA